MIMLIAVRKASYQIFPIWRNFAQLIGLLEDLWEIHATGTKYIYFLYSYCVDASFEMLTLKKDVVSETQTIQKILHYKIKR